MDIYNDKIKFVLASVSPRRQELLARMGIDFEIIPSDAEEETSHTTPDKVVEELSYIKAESVLKKIIAGNTDLEDKIFVVIGADTVVSKAGHIMGKPKSDEDAFDMITAIQADTHQVYTGVTILVYNVNTKNIKSKVFSECTKVTVFPMSETEIKRYIDTGDCKDKAGAYGVQGIFGAFIEKIDGDYTNVVGLPIGRLYQTLKEIEIIL